MEIFIIEPNFGKWDRIPDKFVGYTLNSWHGFAMGGESPEHVLEKIGVESPAMKRCRHMNYQPTPRPPIKK